MKFKPRELDLILVTIVNDKKGRNANNSELYHDIKKKLNKPLDEFKLLKKPAKDLTEDEKKEIEAFFEIEFDIDLTEGELNLIKGPFLRFDDFSPRDDVEALVISTKRSLGI